MIEGQFLRCVATAANCSNACGVYARISGDLPNREALDYIIGGAQGRLENPRLGASNACLRQNRAQPHSHCRAVS